MQIVFEVLLWREEEINGIRHQDPGMNTSKFFHVGKGSNLE